MKTNIFSREVITPIYFQMVKENTMSPLTGWMKGFTSDVSLDGVKITAPISEVEVETMVRQHVLIKLWFQLPGTPNVIAATATISYFLRGSMASKETTITFGISFVTIDFSARDIIGEFILQRVNSPTSNNNYHIQDKKIFDSQRKSRKSCMA